MRICFLVLAHRQPDDCARLIRRLVSDGDVVVVHVDAKVDQDAFERAAAPAPDVVYEPNRVDVKWGSSSIMAAELNMMRTALERFPDADYFWIISGDSYVLQPLPAIKDYLAERAPAEYLNAVPMPAPEFDKPLYRLSHYRLDFDARSDRFRLAYMALNRLGRRPYKHHFRTSAPYGGSSWCMLTRRATRYLVDYLDAHPRFWRYALTTGHTEEWLPHTLLAGEATFRDRIRGALFWADFRPTTPGVKPAVLGDEQIDHLKTLMLEPAGGFPNPSPPLVARKFGPGSDALVERVHQELWPLHVTA